MNNANYEVYYAFSSIALLIPGPNMLLGPGIKPITSRGKPHILVIVFFIYEDGRQNILN